MKSLVSFLLLAALFVIPSFIEAQIPKHLTSDVNKTPFVLNDLSNFIKAYDMLAEDSDTAGVLQKNYFDKASPGLKAFIKRYSLTPEAIIMSMRENPERFKALKDVREIIKSELDGYLAAFVKLNEYIPTALFPPVYFLVSNSTGIGTVSEEGLQISVETWKPNQTTKHTALVTHEMTHYQQAMATGPEKYIAIYGAEKSLLAIVIREGIAEFFADLVTGQFTQEKSRKYVMQNEAMLWAKFQKEMSGKETDDWMWGSAEDAKAHGDIGYVFGALIVKSYYENSSDKKAAIKTILSVIDYPAFLTASKYSAKF